MERHQVTNVSENASVVADVFIFIQYRGAAPMFENCGRAHHIALMIPGTVESDQSTMRVHESRGNLYERAWFTERGDTPHKPCGVVYPRLKDSTGLLLCCSLINRIM